MRKFIVHLSLFTAFLFTYFIIIYVINYNLSDNFSIKEKDVLIIGDSSLGAALDPSNLTSSQNICQNAEAYYLTYLKLKFILRKYKPDTIIVGFGRHNISSFNDYKLTDNFWTDRMFNTNYLFAQDILKIPKIKIDYFKLFLIYSRNMCLIPKSDHYKKFIGKFQGREGYHEIKDYQNTINKTFYYKNYGVSELCISYLDSIINISVKNKITPILIATPVPKEYFELIPENIKERYNLIKKKYLDKGIQVIDFEKEFKYNIEYFYNEEHLNIHGARRFTKEIKEILLNL